MFRSHVEIQVEFLQVWQQVPIEKLFGDALSEGGPGGKQGQPSKVGRGLNDFGETRFGSFILARAERDGETLQLASVPLQELGKALNGLLGSPLQPEHSHLSDELWAFRQLAEAFADLESGQ